MSPTTSCDESMKAITGHSLSYFRNIDAAGFPVQKPKSQKWKEIGLPLPNMQKPSGEDTKMVVLCSMKHDYGSSGLGGY